MDDANGFGKEPVEREKTTKPARVLIIGAGSRGNAYARAIDEATTAVVAAVAEPEVFQREQFGQRYIWRNDAKSGPGQEFVDWKEFCIYEQSRRRRVAVADCNGRSGEENEPGVDAAIVCVLDDMHREALVDLASLQLHVLSEKPLSTSLSNCLDIYSSLLPRGPDSAPDRIFGIGHVLRYSPCFMMLRKLLLERRIIGDVISMDHTEPVGWWHFSHSYVRGNWRKESQTAPSLLTKSCHDLDLLLWLLSAPVSTTSNQRPHVPSTVASTGRLSYFRRARKPRDAGAATNCLRCSLEQDCLYSAKKIYVQRHLQQGNTGWPVKIVEPEIEDYHRKGGMEGAEVRLLERLSEDYDDSTAQQHVDSRPWFGRCVWEASNDVCDDQTVTLSWEDEDVDENYDDDDDDDFDNNNNNNNNKRNLLAPNAEADARQKMIKRRATTTARRLAKTATFHMIAHTDSICQRRGRVYGTHGEIAYDSKTIKVYDFATGKSQEFHPSEGVGGHGGGDRGLIEHFIRAVNEAKSGTCSAEEAQLRHMGCTLDDIIRSHALVFAAEEARRCGKVVGWQNWWEREVEMPLAERLEG